MFESYLIYSDAYMAHTVKSMMTKARFKKLGRVGASDAQLALDIITNLHNVLNKQTLSTIINGKLKDSPYNAYKYAEFMGGRFEQGEKAIASDASYAYYYAMEITHRRFPLGEEVILAHPDFSITYTNRFLNK